MAAKPGVLVGVGAETGIQRAAQAGVQIESLEKDPEKDLEEGPIRVPERGLHLVIVRVVEMAKLAQPGGAGRGGSMKGPEGLTEPIEESAEV